MTRGVRAPPALRRLQQVLWQHTASDRAGVVCMQATGPPHCRNTVMACKIRAFGTEMGPQLLPPGMSLLRSSLPPAGRAVREDNMRLATAAMTTMLSTISAPRRTAGWWPAPWSFVTRSALIRRRRRAGWRADVIRGLRCGRRRRVSAAARDRELVAGTASPQRGLAARRPRQNYAERLGSVMVLLPHVAPSRGRKGPGRIPCKRGRGRMGISSPTHAAAPSPGCLWCCQRTPACSKRSSCCSQSVLGLRYQFSICWTRVLRRLPNDRS